MALYACIGLVLLVLIFAVAAQSKKHSLSTDTLTTLSSSTDSVDFVAEADVYLAYGRTEQAKEILKVALAKNPERKDIQQKLNMLK